MAKEKKVSAITSRDENFAQWYTDIVRKAEMAEYTDVRGCMVIRPYGYAIWENIQRIFDNMIKESGHHNVSMPMFIPESLLQKEKDHVEGFAPEVAWVTHGGSEELEERLCVRPTSETLFCDHWKRVLHSWRDLPMLYNQWCSVVRWEKTTRPFLRSREFLWQEGHTLHATEAEARAETLAIFDNYTDLLENYLCIPVVRGRKTEKEKFAGAVETYTVEAMMHDGKALQGGTSHYFGDGFAKAFDITFSDKENKLATPHQTSWGISTRLIGGIIMSHGDDNGLVLPPAVAPIQVMIVPIAQHKGGVIEKAEELRAQLKAAGIRVSVDASDNSPGWKFAECEMRGIPLRLEIGPKDIEEGACILVRRDTMEKSKTSLDSIVETVKDQLDAYGRNLFAKARENLEQNTRWAYSMDEMKAAVSDRSRFVKIMWCGDEACEDRVKEEAGLSSRCIPLEQEHTSDVCAVCGKKAEHMAYFGTAY